MDKLLSGKTECNLLLQELWVMLSHAKKSKDAWTQHEKLKFFK